MPSSSLFILNYFTSQEMIDHLYINNQKINISELNNWLHPRMIGLHKPDFNIERTHSFHMQSLVPYLKRTHELIDLCFFVKIKDEYSTFHARGN